MSADITRINPDRLHPTPDYHHIAKTAVLGNAALPAGHP
jgi:hypothetical protein